jgi:hypothetical protein
MGHDEEVAAIPDQLEVDCAGESVIDDKHEHFRPGRTPKAEQHSVKQLSVRAIVGMVFAADNFEILGNPAISPLEHGHNNI